MGEPFTISLITNAPNMNPLWQAYWWPVQFATGILHFSVANIYESVQAQCQRHGLNLIHDISPYLRYFTFIQIFGKHFSSTLLKRHINRLMFKKAKMHHMGWRSTPSDATIVPTRSVFDGNAIIRWGNRLKLKKIQVDLFCIKELNKIAPLKTSNIFNRE